VCVCVCVREDLSLTLGSWLWFVLFECHSLVESGAPTAPTDTHVPFSSGLSLMNRTNSATGGQIPRRI